MNPDTPQQPQPDVPATPTPITADDAQRQTPAITLSLGGAAIVDTGDSTGGVKAIAPKKGSTPDVIEWQAQEYISADKSPLWYALLGVFVVGGIALDYFFLHTFFTVSFLVVMIAIVLIVMHVRPARMIHYALDSEGVRVDEQLYPLEEYKAFGVLHDGKENSIQLIPVKRFKPSLQIYFPVESGESIVDSLAEKLPMEELHPDFVDQIVRFLRL